ncbi:hypothetical protein WICPIJ_001987 [Wickerhamomyces pijperi]|uniref:Uncharacterized protein n=1 Tax=Wickerhamomyces pijperi TaxID=599730 RepID=A0A9P8QAJ6_WICPI|nr:hypothetical protein WICPIJ_001987 [Wickerhamomyces pijperi]
MYQRNFHTFKQPLPNLSHVSSMLVNTMKILESSKIDHGLISIASSRLSVTELILPLFDKLSSLFESQHSRKEFPLVYIISDVKNIPFSYLVDKLTMSGLNEQELQLAFAKVKFSQCFDLQGFVQIIEEILTSNESSKLVNTIVLNLKEMFNRAELNDNPLETHSLLNDVLMKIRKRMKLTPDQAVYFLNTSETVNDSWMLDYYIDQKITC